MKLKRTMEAIIDGENKYEISDKLKQRLEDWSRKDKLKVLLEKLTDDEIKACYLEIMYRKEIKWNDPVLAANMLNDLHMEIVKRFFHAIAIVM